MSCAICFEDITESTGRTQLSCKHEFHLKCVVTWLQREEGAGTCPCCRAEPGELEQIGISDSESEGSSVFSEESDPVEGVTPLMVAAVANNVAEIRRLVAEDATTLEALDSDKDTALVYAVRNRRVAATEALIELGADVEAVAILCPDNEDEELTPEFALHGACMWTSAPCIRYLLDSGVNPNCYCTGDGATPLTTVLRSEEDEEDMEEAIRLLMKKGANPFKTDPTGWNTLMWFAEYGIESSYIMRLLVPPGPTDAMAAAAARLIQTSWRWLQHKKSLSEEKACVSILAGLKRTIVNEQTAAEDNWFMARMMRLY